MTTLSEKFEIIMLYADQAIGYLTWKDVRVKLPYRCSLYETGQP